MTIFKRWYLPGLLCFAFAGVNCGYVLNTKKFVTFIIDDNDSHVVSEVKLPNDDHDVLSQEEVLEEVIEQARMPAARFGGLKCRSLSVARGPSRTHKGTDYNCGAGNSDCGTPVCAVKGGLVTANSGQGYGKLVAIQVSNGCRAIYAHLSSITNKGRVGARPKTGDQIGKMGRTGRSPTCHLHYEGCSTLYRKASFEEGDVPWNTGPLRDDTPIEI